MWVVNYEYHFFYILGYSFSFQSDKYWKARLVFEWWKFCYLMNSYPVKLVSLYRTQDGVVFLKESKKVSQNAERIRSLKCSKPKKSLRRPWDYS